MGVTTGKDLISNNQITCASITIFGFGNGNDKFDKGINIEITQKTKPSITQPINTKPKLKTSEAKTQDK